MRFLRNILPFLSPVALVLFLLAVVPANTWHECDHDHTSELHHGNAEMQADHDCALCDFHFSGFVAFEALSFSSISSLPTTHVAYYQAPHTLAAVENNSARAPPCFS